MRRLLIGTLALAASLGLAAAAPAHELDHRGPAFTTGTPGTTFISGGPDATWELLKTFPTGNPQTDLDFFTQKNASGVPETYAAVGTLAAGPNGGGQTIFRLTKNGEVVENPLSPDSPQFVSNHPSAFCLSDPVAALGLQHDVEATPKGNVIFNTSAPNAVRKDAQLLLDATDNEGRCHDATTFGIDPNPSCPAAAGCSPQGGLEIIDITKIQKPVEIGLTSHIGEAHTVNVDPKRPHIAYAVTSDSVNANCDPQDTSCTRANENPAGSARFNLDGFEVVDLSSCMNFSPWAGVDYKRMICRPKVYRYRYPSALMGLGHTVDAVAGCHELEIYPNDLLTCAGIHATLFFDMSGAFDKNGKPRGTPLPCRVRSSATTPYVPGVSGTGAKVTDCVFDESGQELTIPRWLSIGAPSLAGVKFLGAAYHQGRGGPLDSNEDVEVSHEAELSGSRRLIFTTDERGGGVTPPGADCATGMNDVFPFTLGNGGIHAYRVDKLLPSSPSGPDAAAAAAAHMSYARTPSGDKAIYRAEPRTGVEATTCTSHVFHQIPGQNRIFMGWYTQGTQVVDFIERRDGTVEFKEAGFFIPTNANTWTSAVFRVRSNRNGTFTYWGATGDFLIAKGRNAVDIWKVTLPAPPQTFGGGDGDEGCPSNDDADNDGLIDSRESLLFTLLGNPDSDLDGIVDGNDDANGNGEDDEDEDDHDDCPDRDSDGDGEDDEDEDDD
jgi:hypothetical protein